MQKWDAPVLTELALALAQDNQPEEAKDLFTRAKSISERIPRNLREVLEENFGLGKTLLAVVEGLSNIGYMQEAEGIARRIDYPFWRAMMLISLVPNQTHSGCYAEASKLLDEVREIATQVSPCEIRSSVLQRAFTQAVESDLQVEANSLVADLRNCIEEIENEFSRARIQADLVKSLVQMERLTDARELLWHIEHAYWYVIGITHLAKAEVQQVDALFTEAFASVEKIEDQRLKMKAMWEIELAQKQAMSSKSANKSSSETLQSIQKQDEQYFLKKARRDSASELAQAQLFGKAFETMGSQTLQDFFIVLVQWMPSFERVERGLALKILREAVVITGWMAPEWIAISELFLNL